jgi:hypothetical protein
MILDYPRPGRGVKYTLEVCSHFLHSVDLEGWEVKMTRLMANK